MDELDEFDYLRKLREDVVWRTGSKPIVKWQLFFFFMLVATVGLDLLVNDGGWRSAAVDLVFGVFLILIWGFMMIPRTEITGERVLYLRAARTYWGDRLKGAYTVPLAEISRVALQDAGFFLSVEVHRADSGQIVVLHSAQPQELAAAIAEAAGIAKPPLIGRLEHTAVVCGLFGLMIGWVSVPWELEAVTGALGPVPASELLTRLIDLLWPFFITVLAIWLIAIPAFLLMPLYASTEEAANWLRLTPSTPLVRWLGWKSRPYRWLARLVYGRDLDVSAHGSA